MTLVAKSKERFKLTTGSRLHFGLYRFAPKDLQEAAGTSSDSHHHLRDLTSDSVENPWYGGVGLMIQAPATIIEFQPHPRLEIVNDSTNRVWSFVEHWVAWMSARDASNIRTAALPSDLPVRLIVHSSPQPHSGLGAGTQLALAIGQGLTRFFFDSELGPEELAKSVGRGLRSAIGTHGFFRGGLIVDRGKLRSSDLGTLDGAFRLPETWRIVLIMQRDPSLIHGARELQAFKELPEIPPTTTSRLQQLTREAIVPSVLANDFDTFADSIYEYGLIAGQCFNQVQGGPFASARAQWWVDQVREWGFPGIGQSSWGPSLFCFASNPNQADWLLEKISNSLCPTTEYAIITQPQIGPYQIQLP